MTEETKPETRAPAPSAKKTSPPHAAIEAMIMLFGALLVAAIGGELVMRAAFHNSLDFGMEMWKYASQLKQPVANPKLRFVHAPGREAHLMGVDLRINSQGLRDNEYPLEKPPGVYRILYLGDSTTFGWGVPFDETGPKQLERELNRDAPPGRRYEVLNAGVGNYCTVQEVESFMTRGRLFHPDLVILQYFINDAEPVPRNAAGFWSDHSYLRTFVASRMDGLFRITGHRPGWKDYYRGLYDDAQPGWPAAKAALHDLAEATRSDGAGLLVAILPELHEINGEYPFAREHAMVKDAVAKEGAAAIELIDSLRNQGAESTLWVTPADDHPNGKALALVAAQMKAWILSQPQLKN